jgi:hypothetical protein
MKAAILFPRAVVKTLQRIWVLFGWDSTSLSLALEFLASAEKLWDTRGYANCVSYLKECHRILQKAIAGQPVGASSGPHLLGIDRKGLPKLIPHGLRKAVSHGHVDYLRWTLLCTSIYRILKYPAPLKTSTITDGPTVDVSAAMRELGVAAFVTTFRDRLRNLEIDGKRVNALKGLTLGKLEWTDVHSTNKSGPNGPALLTSHLDALNLRAHPVFKAFSDYSRSVASPELVEQVESLANRTAPLYTVARLADGLAGIGKLSTKIEAAGKVRVFAIPDYWTQTLLRPLHKALFTVLRELPTDCTFDQVDGVDRAAKAGSSHYWSFDLSAATDRVPIELQKVVLKGLIGGTSETVNLLVDSWAEILIGRDYILAEDGGAKKGGYTPLRYATGQPMGAYSSWAAFAVTHHFCVQLAANLVLGERIVTQEHGWYDHYMLLGDDVVLWGDEPYHAEVAAKYAQVMTALGCAINMDKSLVSENGTFEFAKRMVQRGVNLTLFHWKEWEAAFGDVQRSEIEHYTDLLAKLNPNLREEKAQWAEARRRLMELERPQEVRDAAFTSFIALLCRRGHELQLLNVLRAWYPETKVAALLAIDKIGNLKSKGMKQLLVQLTSPVGPFPLTPMSWYRLFSVPFSEVLAWAGVNPGLAEIVESEGWMPLREALNEVQQAARTALFTATKEATDGWREVLYHAALDLTLGAEIGKDYQRQLWNMFSFHPWLRIIRRLGPALYEAGLDHVYAPLVEGGMQTADWWINEDLPEEWMLTMSGAPERANAWRKAPLESLLQLPVQELIPYAYPVRGNELVQKAYTRASFVQKAFNKIVFRTKVQWTISLLSGRKTEIGT